jgi:hypothetical protein
MIKRLKKVYLEEHEVVELGTNEMATAQIKILLALTRAKVEIIGVTPEPLPHLVEKVITERLKELLKNV